MSGADDLVAWERMRRDAGLRNAFGGLRSAAFTDEASRDRANRLAADNLLDKALRRLRDGDEATARTLVDRMLRLPFDEADPEVGAALAIDLFLWDAFRELAFAGDDAWVDRALDVPFDDAVARADWFDALRLVAVDDDLPADVRARVLAVTGRTRTGSALAGVGHDARAAAVLADLRALRDVSGGSGA